MRITIELRRPTRRAMALFVGLLLLSAPAVVLASHQFPDVPTGHPFHNEISAIAKAGITAGFGDGTYRPSDPVTRQAMAAFMHRGFGRAALIVGADPITGSLSAEAGSGSSDTTPVRQLTITVPGASNTFSPSQLVHLHGIVTFETSMSTSAKGCPCTFALFISDIASNGFSFAQYQTFESAVSNSFTYSFDVDALFPEPPGPRTFRLEVFLFSRNSNTNAATFNLSSGSSLSAMTFPFGPTGASTL